jgi:hypothetical protein
MPGWFGGYGFSGTMNFFTQMMHIPAPFAFLPICAEVFWRSGTAGGASEPSGSVRHFCQHAGRDLQGTQSQRFLRQFAERLLTAEPDVTRLLTRLERH